MSEQDTELRIREIMREIARACLQRDVVALDGAFAADFTFTDPAGPVVGKEQWIEDIASGALRFESIESGGMEFRHVGDTVRVRGELTIRAHYTKSNYNGTFRYMGVYTKQGGDWKLLLTSAHPALATLGG